MIAGTVSLHVADRPCFVLGRHLTRTGQRGLAVVSRVAGLGLLIGWAWAMAGGTAGTLTLAIGAIAVDALRSPGWPPWCAAGSDHLRTTDPSVPEVGA